MEFVDTLTVIDMLELFGKGSQASPGSPGSQAGTSPTPGQGDASASDRKQADKGRLTSMIGGFKPKAPSDGGQTAKSVNHTLWGSLAIDSNRGPAWRCAINYATAQDVGRRALSVCGDKCRIVMRFSGECAAFAADQ